MAEARIAAIGRALPERAYTQAQLYAHSPWGRTALLDRLFLDSPIQTRSLFVPPDWWSQPRSLDETNAAWRAGALGLGEAAVRDALAGAEWEPASVDFFGATTVTGYTTPGLDLLLGRDLGFRPNFLRAHFNNVGCHAAVPLLKVATDHAARRPGERAIALAAEVCSACFSAEDDAQNLVAISLFADGAAAVALSTEAEGPAIVDFASSYDFGHMDALAFQLGAHGFRIVLDPGIPASVAAGVEEAVGRLLAKHGLRASDVGTWCFHPGGSRILDAVQARLGLGDPAMRFSRRVLRAHGNMSSPSVLFVLAEALAEGVEPDRPIVMAAFGPGLGVEAALLRG